jgi:hypothetical protein
VMSARPSLSTAASCSSSTPSASHSITLVGLAAAVAALLSSWAPAAHATPPTGAHYTSSHQSRWSCASQTTYCCTACDAANEGNQQAQQASKPCTP